MKELLLNQLRAAKYTFQSINDFFDVRGRNIPGLSFFENLLTEPQIAKSICLPTIVSTAVNLIYDSRIIGDNGGDIKVGDFYKIMLPLHRMEPTGLPVPYDMGWKVVDDLGNTYHHAAAAFAKIFDIKTNSLRNFPDVEWIASQIGDKQAFVALSLDNGFVHERTLDQTSLSEIRKIYPDFGQKPGRHAVLAVGFRDSRVLVYDPFQLLGEGENPQIKEYEFSVINKYFRYQLDGSARALVFSKESIVFSKENSKNIFIPDYVEKEILKRRNKFNKSRLI